MNNLRCWPIMVVLLFLCFNVFLPPGLAEAALQCYDCHGTRNNHDIRPEDALFRNPSTGGIQGSHRSHMNFGASINSCSICHPGSTDYTSTHRNGNIKISSKVNSSPIETTYKNSTSAFFQTATPILGSCAGVNCHFEKTTPSWGSATISAPSGCDTCHGAPPSDGSHPSASAGSGKKHGDYLGLDTGSCLKCHANHLLENNKFAHATSAGKRGLAITFTMPGHSGGSYSGNVTYPVYLPSQSPGRTGNCTSVYCHSNGRGGAPILPAQWSAPAGSLPCYGCHQGRATDSNQANCVASPVNGVWSSAHTYCTPDLTMSSNGHHRLVGSQWVRKYPCEYCHSATADTLGNITSASRRALHVNGTVNVVMASKWNIVGRPMASYSSSTKICNNVYCHSDGTTDPETVRPFAWTANKTECNTCHGHPTGSCNNTKCHDNRLDPDSGKVWRLAAKYGNQTAYKWPSGEEWMGALPMFPNQGPGTARANSHPRHAQTNFTCDQCHAATVTAGACTTCHVAGIPPGAMGEVAHINPANHVNKNKDVIFAQGGNYNADRTCSNTKCHTGGTDPQWGGSINSAVTCLSCHGTPGVDVNDFDAFNGIQGKINLTQWVTTGHGRMSSAVNTGSYPKSGNPAAKFPGNPCWYCHDNSVLHKDASNPFRLKMHIQYEKRFEKECVYCHMEGTVLECLACHVGQTESLSPQATTSGVVFKFKNGSTVTRFTGHTYISNCTTGGCHDSDSKTHKVNAGVWTPEQKADVRNQYMMMGVCLQCHDDDSSNQCSSCHIAPPENRMKYSLGYDPGTGFIKPKKARASAGHFGYKHYRDFKNTGGWEKDGNGKVKGTWKGGKFCWDCHDPHGDSNIYMIHNKVATSTDGKFGVPITQAVVSFTDKQSGANYAKKSAPFDGICNVCHSSNSKHFTSVSGDPHNYGRVCTTCHEHRFADSHASKQSCDSCHESSKPIPKHTAFGLPRDCTKCHTGTVGLRMDVMGQMKSNSHHVQGIEVNNKHCYACHWEATPEGLIDNKYHTGYNFKTYSSVKNDPVDLVIWKPGKRPTYYNSTTALQFLAKNIGTASERTEAGKVTNHCLSCHSDQNNDTQPFDDCKTPRQFAWDQQSIAARYSQTGTTTWGKIDSTRYPNANQKDKIIKAFSGHGNVNNQGGYDETNGTDAAITSTRGGGGANAVQCFDCHSSHGSTVVGITSSYKTFNGTHNGGNLKETQAGKGGYVMSYKASSNTTAGAINPYNPGAGQCFDCHINATTGTELLTGKTPWGYTSTFGATSKIKGYFDPDFFGNTASPARERYAYKKTTPGRGGHMKKSSFLNHSTAANNKINGLCTPCHDPHGVSPTLGAKQKYAVPMLKGTWMTSLYQDDAANPDLTNPPGNGPRNAPDNSPWHWYPAQPTPAGHTDQNTLGGLTITEDSDKFAGLCLRCHYKENLTNGVDHDWKGQDRVHESVKGWKTANSTIQHSFTCSKCHAPHTSGLPRLMITNCLDTKHRGRVPSGGIAGSAVGFNGSTVLSYRYSRRYVYSGSGSFPKGYGQSGVNCHPNGTWPDNSWNGVTPW